MVDEDQEAVWFEPLTEEEQAGGRWNAHEALWPRLNTTLLILIVLTATTGVLLDAFRKPPLAQPIAAAAKAKPLEPGTKAEAKEKPAVLPGHLALTNHLKGRMLQSHPCSFAKP